MVKKKTVVKPNVELVAREKLIKWKCKRCNKGSEQSVVYNPGTTTTLHCMYCGTKKFEEL